MAAEVLVMQTEDGQVVEPHSISAGLDYPGIGPLHAHLYQSGRAKFLCVTDEEALQASFECGKAGRHYSGAWKPAMHLLH